MTQIRANSATDSALFREMLSRRPEQKVKSSGKGEKIVAIGASTGGTEAIRRLIRELPLDLPGMLIVQHMPIGFTRRFADSLNQEGRFKVAEAKNGDCVRPGQVLIAPSGQHMTVRRSGDVYIVQCSDGATVNGHRPSVDVLFHSVANAAAANAVGVILTGMGADGAAGLVAMRRAGAKTIGQDEGSSIVYGMPKVADDLGGVEVVQPLEGIAASIVRCLGGVWP
ncbi:CheB methylesterase domain-containing protein [Azotosporobacter soli]|uniref:CheB methylesterase domain-containing protein n=1 Tax=Azotosporobacter soli TaxID=3055040 RepID=UPI0031FED9C0